MTTDIFVKHYTEVADASPKPVILYNVTMYTGVNLQVDAVEQLSEHPNIAGIKDSGNDMVQLADYIARAKQPGFVVLVGAAPSLFAATALGAHGAVLALAGVVPELCVEVVEHVKAGRVAEARTLQRTLMPLARSIGPVWAVPGLKAALDMLGLAGGVPRPPLRSAPQIAVETIRKQLADLKVGAVPALSLRG
jgi:4-hydroxy-2-oxoglutarate aldolase